MNRHLLCVLGIVSFGNVANAAPPTLTLTSDGSAAGYAITTFADNFPTGSPYGPRGIAFPDGGGVLVTHRDGSMRKFLNVDGQHADAVTVVRNYGSGNASALVKLGGKIYIAQPANGQLTQVNDDGTIAQVLVSGISNITAIAAGSTGSHIIAASPEVGLVQDIDISTKFVTDVKEISTPALAVSNDGRIFYAVFSNQIIGYRTSDGAQAFFGGPLTGVSGIAVGTGPTANFLFVNTTDGRVVRISQDSGVQTTIATGGSRGDFMATAPDGSIFVTQADHILRITPRATGPAPTFSLSAASAVVPAAGATGSVNVTASTTTAAWTASSNASWATVNPASGRGNGSVSYTVAANTTALQRVAILTIAGISFTISQAGSSGGQPATFQLSPTSATVPAVGGTSSVTVTANDPTATWTATSNAPWVTLSSSSGRGSGSVTFAAAANTTSVQRVAVLTIAGLGFTITQNASGAGGGFQLSSSAATVPATGGSGTVAITASSATATWTASSNATWATLAPASGTGNGAIAYTASANTGAQRVATLTIAGLPFTLTQAGTGGEVDPSIPLRLTAQGLAAGLSITSFITGFTQSGDRIGPLGMAFPDSGGFLVAHVDGSVRRFPRTTDGQRATDVAPTRGYGNTNAVGMAKANGRIYLAQQGAGQIVQLNDDGSLNQVIATGLVNITGLVANPASGHLFASSYASGALWEIDPIAKRTTIFQRITGDGLAVSPDNSILYAESGARILGFRIADGIQVFDSGVITGADGCAIGSGALAGFLFVNTTDGRLVQVNLTNSQQTVIASGGSRGDFVEVDPANGSLLVTQSDRILRVSASGGGGFGGASPFTLSTTSFNVGAGSGTGSINVTSTSAATAWTAASTVPWLTVIAGSSGTGNGRVEFAFTANTGQTSRTGTLAIAGLFATVTQERGADPNIPLKLTAEGLSAGLTISTFIDRFTFNFNGVGPLGIAFPDSGGVLVTNVDGSIRKFPNARDGQHADDVAPIRNYGVNNAFGLAKFEGRIFMAQAGLNRVAEIDDTGAVISVIMNGLFEAVGVAANPINRRVYGSGTQFIAEWDRVSGDPVVFVRYGGDGVTVSPDGKMLYIAENNRILGFTIPGRELTFESAIPGADGCAIGEGVFAGLLFVNATDGRFWQVNLATGEKTVLASGGSRGDFVTPDPNDGSLLITQSDRILRIRAGNGGSFGGISFTLSETSAEVSSGGGTGTISITASSPAAPWIAVSNASWIRIVTGASGTGNGSVSYSVSANPSSSARTGTLTAGGNTFTITQQGFTAPDLTGSLPEGTCVSGLVDYITFSLATKASTLADEVSIGGRKLCPSCDLKPPLHGNFAGLLQEARLEGLSVDACYDTHGTMNFIRMRP